MKAMVRMIQDGDKRYSALAFICPGCESDGQGTGLHLLPVNTEEKSPSWGWDGNLTKPTLNPSILTRFETEMKRFVCHSYLREGIFEFLDDCTHSLVGQKVEMVDLPDWFVEETRESQDE